MKARSGCGGGKLGPQRAAGLCPGAFLLGQMGLLDGRRATTHWSYARHMRELFPEVRVEEDRIFINEGSVWTSAGLTAGLDLAVALIEKDLRREVAEVAALSPRQFARAFRTETGLGAGLGGRADPPWPARLMIEETRHPMDQIARENGFVDLRRMREAFMRHYGQPPQTLRRLARSA